MSAHLVLLEFDFSRSQYGTPWEADEDVPRHREAEAEDFAKSLGTDWDHPPFTAMRGSLTPGMYRALCGLVHPSDEADPAEVIAAQEDWDRLRALFPLADARTIHSEDSPRPCGALIVTVGKGKATHYAGRAASGALFTRCNAEGRGGEVHLVGEAAEEERPTCSRCNPH